MDENSVNWKSNCIIPCFISTLDSALALNLQTKPDNQNQENDSIETFARA